MEKIYVTESGFFNKYGYFESNGVIGVDKTAKNAVSYIYESYKALPVNRKLDNLKEVTYKVEGDTLGFRISIHKL